MHFQFLIEDASGEELIKQIMAKVKAENPEITYDSKSFHGIGGFTRKNTVKEIKDGKLLDSLATYLGGFNKSLKSMGKSAAVFVVVDNDNRNTDEFRNELEQVATNKGVTIDHVFCIAVEEMEAWLLGDENAISSAYPQAKTSLIRTYKQDSICGTWEMLADVVYPKGRVKLKKDCKNYQDIGTVKYEWAQKIGAYLDIHKNQSPSFNYFMKEIEKRLPVTA